MRLAFGLIAVEQRWVRLAGDNQRQLPAEIGGVAQARAQALPGKGRRLVRGSAGQQDPALAPVRRDPGVEAINRLALDRDGAFDIPWREQRRDSCARSAVSIDGWWMKFAAGQPPGPSWSLPSKRSRIAPLALRES